MVKDFDRDPWRTYVAQTRESKNSTALNIVLYVLVCLNGVAVGILLTLWLGR